MTPAQSSLSIFLFRRHVVKFKFQEKLYVAHLELSGYQLSLQDTLYPILESKIIMFQLLLETRFKKEHLVMIKKRRRKLIALSLLVLVPNLADLNGGHNLTILMPPR